jgi:hypothetical protein
MLFETTQYMNWRICNLFKHNDGTGSGGGKCFGMVLRYFDPTNNRLQKATLIYSSSPSLAID